ncbi:MULTISPECIES: hypothetical protein [unclassified Mesorhizobium]|uniref:hypothetical protein n=1 Tax=unclassified Mesorhizobium TaxID=325217 RepID=UPI001FF052FD|nr:MULTISPECIES: hypothetical protein [unclassified Mesorhizobium]
MADEDMALTGVARIAAGFDESLAKGIRERAGLEMRDQFQPWQADSPLDRELPGRALGGGEEEAGVVR